MCEDKFVEVMSDIGVQIKDSEGNTREIYDIFLDYKKAWQKLSEEEKERVVERLK